MIQSQSSIKLKTQQGRYKNRIEKKTNFHQEKTAMLNINQRDSCAIKVLC